MSTAGPSINSGVSRRLLAVALLLTLVAEIVALIFVSNTTGGTLFLFTTITPGLVVVGICLLVGILILDYRHRHSLFRTERYKAGTTVFREGDEGSCVYFIRSGEVHVVRQDGSIIATRGAGEHFGEMALVSNAVRSASIRTAKDTVVSVLGKENFHEMLRMLPASEEAILTTIKERALEARR